MFAGLSDSPHDARGEGDIGDDVSTGNVLDKRKVHDCNDVRDGKPHAGICEQLPGADPNAKLVGSQSRDRAPKTQNTVAQIQTRCSWGPRAETRPQTFGETGRE